MPAMVEEVRAAAEAGAAGPHFLVVTYPAQGHINPARHLARRLLRATGARVTISTAASAFRKMFPGDEEGAAAGECHRDAAGVWYVPYSDGYDAGFDRAVHDHTHYMSQVRVVGSRTLGAVLERLRAAGRPVTLVVYTLLLSWVADVARGHGVPAALYWIQPATVLAAYLHFFRGTDGVDRAIAAAGGDPMATVRVPGLPPLRIRDLPSFIANTSEDDPYAFVANMFRELVDMLGREGSPSVLTNTFDAMEPEAVASLREHGVDIVPVGPVLSFLDEAPGGRVRVRREERRQRPVQAGRHGLPRVAGRAGARLGGVHLVREPVDDEQAADRGGGARHGGERAAVPVGAAGGQPQQRGRR